jgi:hypothetical protein
MVIQMTKSQLMDKITTETELIKKMLTWVCEILATIGYNSRRPAFSSFQISLNLPYKNDATKECQGHQYRHKSDDIERRRHQGQAFREDHPRGT